MCTVAIAMTSGKPVIQAASTLSGMVLLISMTLTCMYVRLTSKISYSARAACGLVISYSNHHVLINLCGLSSSKGAGGGGRLDRWYKGLISIPSNHMVPDSHLQWNLMPSSEVKVYAGRALIYT